MTGAGLDRRLDAADSTMNRVNPGDEAQLLSKLDELSDEDVTLLLKSLLNEGEAVPPPARQEKQEAQGARADLAAGGADELQLLSRLDQLSDEEVTNLLGEMLSVSESPRPAEAVGAGLAASGTVPEGLDQTPVEQLTDDEVTSLLSRLMAGEEASR